jgi:hypothetical protein
VLKGRLENEDVGKISDSPRVVGWKKAEGRGGAAAATTNDVLSQVWRMQGATEQRND